MSPVIKFSLLCIAAIIGVSLIFWALAGFSSFGLDSDDFKFLALGSVFTCLLGIGLSICQSIVEAHQGRLSVAANQPRGAIFQFNVPS